MGTIFSIYTSTVIAFSSRLQKQVPVRFHFVDTTSITGIIQAQTYIARTIRPTLRTLFFFFSFFNLNYIRWTSSLPSCLWSLRIFPSLPGSRLTIFIAMQVQHYSILSPVLLSFDVGGVRDYPVGVQIDPSGSE